MNVSSYYLFQNTITYLRICMEVSKIKVLAPSVSNSAFVDFTFSLVNYTTQFRIKLDLCLKIRCYLAIDLLLNVFHENCRAHRFTIENGAYLLIYFPGYLKRYAVIQCSRLVPEVYVALLL